MFKKKRKKRSTKISYGLNKPTYKYKKRTPRKKISKQTTPRKKGPIILLIISIIAVFIYFTHYSNTFKIKTVVVRNSDFENQQLNKKIKEETLKISKNKSLYPLETSEIETEILNKISKIETVKITKNYPDTLEITYNKLPQVANVIVQNKSIKNTYIINNKGYITQENAKNNSLPIIELKLDSPASKDTPLIKNEKLKYIIDATKYFEDKFGMKVKRIEYKKYAREAHLLTEKDFYIWLDIQQPYTKQLKKLKKALTELDIYNEKLLYIDLRIAGEGGEKIIFKRKQ